MAAASPAGPKRAVLVGTVNSGGEITGVASGSAHGPVDCSAYPYLKLYIVSSDTLSAGTLVIEERDQPGDTPGTIATVNLGSVFGSAGGSYAYPIAPQAYGYISAHIGTSVVGGLVYAVLRAC